MKSSATAILTASLAFVLPACNTMQLREGYAGPQPLPAERRDLFRTPEPAGSLQPVRTLQKQTAYRVIRYRIESQVNLLEDHPIFIDWYRPNGEGRRPLILTLPILGGRNRVANHFAATFVRAGFSAAIVHRQEKYKQTDDLETLNRVFPQIVLDHRQALDHLLREPDVDPKRVGLFGVSYGGIRGSLIAAAEPRIGASVLGLAGGDLAHILAHSSEKGIVRRRQKLEQEHQIGPEQLAEEIRRGFEHDPLVYAPSVDARKTLLILAAFDTVVPYRRCGLALREAMGGPKTLVVPAGHYSSILFLPWIEARTVHFFRSHFQQPAHSARSSSEGGSGPSCS